MARYLACLGQQLADAARSRVHPRRPVHRHEVALAGAGRPVDRDVACPHDENHTCVIPTQVVHSLWRPVAADRAALSAHSNRGATTSMSSRQCLGGGGSSSGAIVNLSSTPQTLHRYLTFTLRISPAGGGGGSGRVRAAEHADPDFPQDHGHQQPAERPQDGRQLAHAQLATDIHDPGGASQTGRTAVLSRGVR